MTDQKGTGEKMQDIGSKIQKVGCALTVLITIPILLIILLGGC
jgi:hypothetical protein